MDIPKNGRPCAICSHEQKEEIEAYIKRRITSGQTVTFRNITEKYGMSNASVSRHISDHLKLNIQVALQEKRIDSAIDVYEEFREQLEFAKDLRLAAREYLSDVNDPLKISITPKAHEIEVTYFDWNDLEVVGFGEDAVERPKKKVAQLSVILESLADEGIKPDKFKITTIDIRKFALDAINTTDTCIDKFAKLGGSYSQDKPNPLTLDAVVQKVIDGLTEAELPQEAIDYVLAKKFPDYKPVNA